MKKLLFSAAIAATMIGCSSPESKSEAQTAENKSEAATVDTENCPYVLANNGLEVHWTAYKTSEKIGVNGRFEDIMAEGMDANAEPIMVFQHAKVIIPIAGLNSDNEIRDPKIKDSFFGSLGINELIGKVRTIEPTTETNGKITLSVMFNQIENPVVGEYTVEGNEITAKFDINVEEWNAASGITELNKVCEDLHTGADGKSVLWPDVTVTIKAKVKKAC